MKNRFLLFLLALSGLLLLSTAILYTLGSSGMAKPLLILALAILTVAFRGFSALKGFAYTMWIVVAVTAAMFYPQHFILVGDFQLKRVIVPFVQVTMFGMGSQMSFDDFKGIVRMPKGVLLGVSCHFIIMPVVGFSLSHLFRFEPEIAAGVILIGCVSSAMASNVMSYLAGANLALAVTIGACSTILSPLVTPFLMQWLGGQYIAIDVSHMMLDITNMIIIPIVAGFIFNLFYFNNENSQTKLVQLISFFAIILMTSLLMMWVQNWNRAAFLKAFATALLWFFLLPMGAALVLKKVLRSDRAAIERILAFIAMIGIVINTTVITASGRDNLLRVGGLLIVTCLLHNLTGFSVGYGMAWLFRLPEKDRRTIAFEVGMQNGGVATGLALQMGKVATVGLASAIFGPLQNITGSILANWFRRQTVKDRLVTLETDLTTVPADEESKAR